MAQNKNSVYSRVEKRGALARSDRMVKRSGRTRRLRRRDVSEDMVNESDNQEQRRRKDSLSTKDESTTRTLRRGHKRHESKRHLREAGERRGREVRREENPERAHGHVHRRGKSKRHPLRRESTSENNRVSERYIRRHSSGPRVSRREKLVFDDIFNEDHSSLEPLSNHRHAKAGTSHSSFIGNIMNPAWLSKALDKPTAPPRQRERRHKSVTSRTRTSRAKQSRADKLDRLRRSESKQSIEDTSDRLVSWRPTVPSSAYFYR